MLQSINNQAGTTTIDKRQFVLGGVGIFIGFYFADILLDWALFGEGTFTRQLFTPDLHEIGIRLLSGLALAVGLSYGWLMLGRVRKSEQTLLQRTIQLQQANRDLEMFSHSLAHDLRGLLTGLNVAGDLLADDLEQVGVGHPASLQHIQRASDRMEQTINSLLQLTDLEQKPLAKDRINLSAMVRSGLQRRQTALPERQFDIQVAPDLYAWGDEAMLTLALENLVCNAVKYSAERNPAEISFNLVQHAAGRAFCLADNGCGFPRDCANRIFLPFNRLHNNSDFPGQGIGLATVQRIIERHGGRVWAEGAPGKGARLYFVLPES